MNNAGLTGDTNSRTRGVAALHVGRRAILVVGACLCVVGCTQREDTFGASYDECVLKNIRGGDTTSEGLALQSCRRHFEIKPLSQQSETLSAVEKEQGGKRWFEFTVSNDHRDRIVTAVTITMYPWKAGKDGKRELLPSQSWSFDTDISPNGQTVLYGGIDTPLPSKSFDTSLVVDRQIDIAK